MAVQRLDVWVILQKDATRVILLLDYICEIKDFKPNIRDGILLIFHVGFRLCLNPMKPLKFLQGPWVFAPTVGRKNRSAIGTGHKWLHCL